MPFAFGKESVYRNLNNSQIFEFSNEESTLILSGYSEWKAYISSGSSNIWVEIIPKIDINKQLIYLPKSKSAGTPPIPNIAREVFEKRKHEFFNTVPGEVTGIVKCYSDSHWEIVRAIKYLDDDLIRLISANPALAYILVHIEKFNPSFRYYNDMELLREMILKKQKEILRISSFPGSDRIVKAVLKLNPLDISIKTLIKLKQVLSEKSELSDRILNLLSFTGQVNNNLLNLFTEHKEIIPLLSSTVIFELTESLNYAEYVTELANIQEDCSLNKLSFPEIKTVTGLRLVREKINQKIQILQKFPDPPLKGNQYIQPLTNEKELISWSKRQGNCIRGFGGSIRSGSRYMYKVIIGSEEATLEIKPAGKRLKMGSLLGVNNNPVSPELKTAVTKWFHKPSFTKSPP